MKKQKKWYEIVINIVLVVAIIVCAASFVFKATFVKVTINGNSMYPSVGNGGVGYMYKVKDADKVERYDIVAANWSSKDSYYIIKRVLGLPNEKVSLYRNELLVNGKIIPQDFTYVRNTVEFIPHEWTLAEDEYLLVGDNRAATISPVVDHISKIIGKNGFAYLTYDIDSSSCENFNDYTGCEIENRKWYLFKNGK
jgi:signal peptidase I